jgi:hypothetical protein
MWSQHGTECQGPGGVSIYMEGLGTAIGRPVIYSGTDQTGKSNFEENLNNSR